MTIDVKTLPMVNLAIQILLFILASAAVYLAKKSEFDRHCTFMRVLVPVQIIAIAVVMFPSMLGYLENENPVPFFNIEMLVHHTLGLAVIALWIYIILAFGKAWMPRNLRAVMRSAFVLWMISLLFGLHMYIRIWI
jgi:putative membrane protein